MPTNRKTVWSVTQILGITGWGGRPGRSGEVEAGDKGPVGLQDTDEAKEQEFCSHHCYDD